VLSSMKNGCPVKQIGWIEKNWADLPGKWLASNWKSRIQVRVIYAKFIWNIPRNIFTPSTYE